MRMIFSIVFVACHVGSFYLAAGQPVLTESPKVEDSIFSFAAESFKHVAANANGNVVYSPLSAWMVLTMANYGAGGRTRLQMNRLLSLKSNETDTARGLIRMMRNFAKAENYELRTANKIFMDNQFQPTDFFVRLTDKIFQSKVQRLNFFDTVNTAEIVNNWAADNTNNRIIKLVAPGSLSRDTRLLLANAVYFKGSWAMKFADKNTTNEPFYVDGTTIKNVPTMKMTEEFVYGHLEKTDSRFVQLPYLVGGGADDMSMFIVLPNKRDGLAKLVENFDKDFELLFDTGDMKMEVELRLPKFKIESSIDLKDALEKMDSGNMFSSSANFSVISETRGLHMNGVTHNALIEIDEQGSEAAAATAVGLQFLMGNFGTAHFHVDHPFVCVIATSKKVPVFMAVVTDPTGSSQSTGKVPPQQFNPGWVPREKYDNRPIFN